MWQSSDDTADGQWRHRSVDGRFGALPDDGTVQPQTVRSVTLSDESWGLTCVVDRVDLADGTCFPVEYKRGRPDREGQPWPADRMQVWAQCALLEVAGFTVARGEVSYAETHERVSVPWTDEARSALREAIAGAREVAAASRPPLPLIDSAKCTRCSLAGLCLPDEINAVLARGETSGRRILPRDPDARPVYVSEPGSVVAVRGGRLVITRDREVLAEARLIDVQSLVVFGNVQVSTQALSRLWGAGAIVLYLSTGGWLQGWSQGQPSKNVEVRRRQVVAGVTGWRFAAAIVRGKIRNQRTLLRRLSRGDARPASTLAGLAELAERAGQAQSVPELLGIEGTAARLYFDAFPQMLADSPFRAAFEANGRERRPAPDPVNCVLGYAYALLTKDLVVACLAVGLDPYLGVLHRPRFGRPSLALDLMEEFRPLVADSVVVSTFNNGELSEGDFVRRGVGVQLTVAGRKAVIAAYERRVATLIRHPVYKYRISYRRLFEVQARVLAAAMVGEIPDYVPVVTR